MVILDKIVLGLKGYLDSKKQIAACLLSITLRAFTMIVNRFLIIQTFSTLLPFTTRLRPVSFASYNAASANWINSLGE